MLSQSELLQFSRHIILPEIDIQGQEAIKSSHVLIIGLGGLGSPAAMYLAAAGVGEMTVVDNDLVETSNLQRQIIHQISTVGKSKTESARAAIESLSPYTKVNTISEKASREVLGQFNSSNLTLALDCTDNFESRFLINEWSVANQIPLVSATAVAFSGQLAVFNRKQEDACYHCLYSNMDLPEGDCTDQGILSPIVGTMGSLQATEALKLILELEQPNGSFLLKYESLKTTFQKFKVPKDPNCSVCS